MRGEATLLVNSQAEIERGCYFLSVIFFTGRLCNVDGNWTESKRMKYHQSSHRICARFKV